MATAAAMTKKEEDIRVAMLNSFMTCPHRDTDKIKEVHEELQKKDPQFYAHLACWYIRNGELRDHNEIFSALLACDPYVDNRETGLALFRNHAPFMKAKILGFVKGKEVKIRTKTGKKIKVGKKQIDDVKITKKFVGLSKNPPSSFRTEIKNYLGWLETHPEQFDSVALRSFEDLKALYYPTKGKHGIKPSERAHKILWDKEFPKDSKLNVLKQIADCKKPEEQAKLIVESKLSYGVAVGLVDKVTPTVLVALINAMTPSEVINNIASLQEKGAFDNPDVKALIESKLVKAKTDKKVSTLKSKTAAGTGRVKDESILKQLDQVADTQVKKSGAIKIPTAIFVDKSGSMKIALEVGKRVAALVSGASEAPLYVQAFDTMSREVIATDKTLTAWEKAFQPLHADGGTSVGCSLDYLLRKKQYVEQIIVITDEDENQAPYFHDVFPKYVEAMKITPNVVVLNVTDKGGSVNHNFTTFLTRAKIAFDVYKPADADYYGLPGLIPILARNSKLDLVYEVMETPLLKRKAFK